MPTWNASLQAVVFLFMAISLQSDSIEILKYSDKASMSYNFYQNQVQKLYCQKNVKSKKMKSMVLANKLDSWSTQHPGLFMLPALPHSQMQAHDCRLSGNY